MKVVLPVAALFGAFQKVEGNDELVQAKVVSSTSKAIKLEGIGNSVVEVAYEGDALKSGQSIQFNAGGEIQGTPELAKPKAKPTGSSSPAFAAPASGRDGFAKRV